MLKLLIACFLLLSIPAIVVAADNQEPNYDLPDWIKERALKSKKLTVERYEYGGKIYYLTSSLVPDGLSNLYDSDGNHICAPWGGISGRGSGQCPDFVRKDLKNGTIIWGPLVDLIFKDYQQQKKSDLSHQEPTTKEVEMFYKHVCPIDGSALKIVNLPSAHSYSDTSKTAYYCWKEQTYWVVQIHGAFRGFISNWYGPYIINLNKKESEEGLKPDNHTSSHLGNEVTEPPIPKATSSLEQKNKLQVINKIPSPDKTVGLVIQKRMPSSNKGVLRWDPPTP